jgi:KipI family sensor histidine kinase inhibitor
MPTIREVADDALLWSVDTEGASDNNTLLVVAFCQALEATAPWWLVAMQPAYCSVQVVYDAFADVDVVKAALLSMSPAASVATSSPTPLALRHHDLQVVYGGDAGPDIVDVAAACGLSVNDVIAVHSAPVYRCAFTGFVPGFPYLLGLDERLAVPRRAAPRPAVPAGSVAIAAGQAGIYPGASPGGWQLLGRVVDVKALQPGWIRAGDTVRFVPTGVVRTRES